MAEYSSAARTNLTSRRVQIDYSDVLGEGQFRTAFGGTYIGGNRNQQEAVCKCFKHRYMSLESEFYRSDFQVMDKAIWLAEEWNNLCPVGKEVLITRGSIMKIGHTQYLVEPLIRYFTKFTSNNGWIASADDAGREVLWMEAFAHFSYHRSGGSLIICDLQGRYRNERGSRGRRRFELTDPAICSRRRLYGITDLGEKGIESFFANHYCNRYCEDHWAQPRAPQQWFHANSSTSMISGSQSHYLRTTSAARFNSNLQPIHDNYDSDDSDDSW